LKSSIQASQESFNTAYHIVDIITLQGGVYFYEKYLETKRKKHCAKRTMQLFSEGV
jgi:hypothetical protein